MTSVALSPLEAPGRRRDSLCLLRSPISKHIRKTRRTLSRSVAFTDQAGAVDKKVEEFGRVLHCQRLSVLKMAERYPQLLRMSPSELTQRLASIKGCLPGCDASDLAKAEPDLFLGSDSSLLEAQILDSYQQLHAQLPSTVDVDAVVQHQPAVLFQSRARLRAALGHVRVMQLDHIDPADTARLLQVYNGWSHTRKQARFPGDLMEWMASTMLAYLQRVTCAVFRPESPRASSAARRPS